PVAALDLPAPRRQAPEVAADRAPFGGHLPAVLDARVPLQPQEVTAHLTAARRSPQLLGQLRRQALLRDPELVGAEAVHVQGDPARHQARRRRQVRVVLGGGPELLHPGAAGLVRGRSCGAGGVRRVVGIGPGAHVSWTSKTWSTTLPPYRAGARTVPR